MHLCSDSGTDRNYHAQDTAGSARNDIMIEVLKNAMFGPAQFSVCFRLLDRRDAISWGVMDYRQNECFRQHIFQVAWK